MKDENVENGKRAGGMMRRKDRIFDGNGVGRYDGDGARICAKNCARIGAGVLMAVAMMGQMVTAVWAGTERVRPAVSQENGAAALVSQPGVSERVQKKEGTDGQAQTVMYGIGSTSKVVVTAAVMKLVEDGLVDLDAPLTEYIPEFEMADERYVRITPRMLLDHSSGIQGSTLVNAMLLGDNDTDNHDNLLRRLRSQRLKAEPGAFSTYCNDGFTLAEILVERVSKKSYTEFLEETFAKPLGLSNVKTPQNIEDMGRLAPVYDGQTGKELPGEMANVIGSGGVYATAEDLCRFSQVFMDGRSGAGDMLSDASLREMETSEYGKQMNPERRDTNLMYGLGWDSVDTFPFSQYGVKALVKGGDTSFYHASLTVLPEENISCAVLSSGGGSAYCQMAVQEILLEYLEEIGEIERHDENPFRETDGAGAASQVSAELLEKSGWYAGWDMFRAEVEADGTLTLGSVGSNVGSVQTYRYGDDGRFYGEFGAYINSSGDMSRGSNGIIGKTALEFKTGDQGQQYLMAASYEIYPGLGSTAMYLPLAEKVAERPVTEKTKAAWDQVNGTEYYLVSDKYTSTSYMTNFLAVPKVLDGPEGYLVFEKSMLTMAALEDEHEARFFLQVPGQVGRDVSDYRIFTRDGKDYLETSGFLLLSEKSVEELPAGNEVITIGNDGEARWFTSDKIQAARPVSIRTPEKGAFFIYDHSGKEMTCISSSYVLEPGQQITLPKEGRVVFVGEAGSEFQIEYH